MSSWRAYWGTVSDRVKIDRGAFRIAWVVTWLTLRGWVRQIGRQPSARIAYAPHPGGPWYTMPLALRYTTIKPTRRVSRADIVMIFDDQTKSQPPHEVLPDQGILTPTLNSGITDISKANVGAVFGAVFGYDITVDPTTYSGLTVEKSEVNGVHDGRIIQGPIAQPKADCAYQKLVQSTVREGVTEDLRCTCVGGDIVQVFRKEKADEKRFSTTYLGTVLYDKDKVFSEEEQEQIRQFCNMIGLDFGSIDVLRDHLGNGKIYIVDVNKTCMPVLSMPLADLEIGLRKIGAATEALIHKRIHQPNVT